MRSEHWEHIKRDQEEKLAKQTLLKPFVTNRPWESVIRQSVGDQEFWNEAVRFQAMKIPSSISGSSSPSSAAIVDTPPLGTTAKRGVMGVTSNTMALSCASLGI
eukprot:6405242-Amphidinium_carterae.1